MELQTESDTYPARLQVDYPEHLGRLSTLLRIPFSIPIWILSALMPIAPVILVSLAADGLIDENSVNGAAAAAFFLPLVLMLLFRQKYPRWGSISRSSSSAFSIASPRTASCSLTSTHPPTKSRRFISISTTRMPSISTAFCRSSNGSC